MGIPRLTKDLEPYSESVILGNGQADHIEIRVRKVVIDGPSLVFHVYNQLVKCLSSEEFPTTPSYTIINSAIVQFLKDLTDCGVSVVQILFDGSLPASKRDIRLDRLEKTRRHLDRYRRSDGLVPQATRTFTQLDLRAALWDSIKTVRSQYTLPAPPFLVAAAIECLLQSSWEAITFVVNAEADGHCARTACAENAAVLSNDSDLFLFDLGEHGSVIQFHSLNLALDSRASPSPILTARCFRPNEIARKLNVPGLLALGFQRYKDSSVSLGSIIQQAKESPSRVLEDKKAWKAFRKQFQIVNFAAHIRISEPNALLDPRIAELVSLQQQGSSKLHSYLPVLIEDPTRDSSWVYGRQIRQLAYSILIYSLPMSQVSNHEYVVEYARSGHRIATENMLIFSISKVCRLLEMFQQDYAARLGRSHRSSHEEGGSYLAYLIVANEIIIAVKSNAGKDYDHEALKRIFYKPQLNQKCNWNDLHLNANIQAVIYSVRMLKQLTQYARTRVDVDQADLRSHLDRLCEALQDMPPLQEVMLNPTDTCAYMSKIPAERRRSTYHKLLTTVREEKSQNDMEAPQKMAIKKSVPTEQQLEDQLTPWSTVQARKFSQKSSPEAVASTPPNSRESSNTVSKAGKAYTLNRFDLLQDI